MKEALDPLLIVNEVPDIQLVVMQSVTDHPPTPCPTPSLKTSMYVIRNTISHYTIVN